MNPLSRLDRLERLTARRMAAPAPMKTTRPPIDYDQLGDDLVNHFASWIGPNTSREAVRDFAADVLATSAMVVNGPPPTADEIDELADELSHAAMRQNRECDERA